MAQYIVHQPGTRFGMFDTRHEADRWGRENLDGLFDIRMVVDKSEAEKPSLKVGDVVRIKDKDRRVGMPAYVPGGSEGVVVRTGEASVTVTFYASHSSVPDKEWTSQQVDRRDLIKIAHACSHL